MSKIIIFGTGKGAEIAYKHFKLDSDHEICGFFLDKEFKTADTFHDLPVVTFEEVKEVFPPDKYKMFILMGFEMMNKIRTDKYLKCKEMGYSFESYVSSDIHALVKPEVGENCFIMDNQTLNLDVKIGNNVIMWSGNHIGDETVIRDHAYFCSHVCVGGKSIIGEYCFFGNNSTVADNVRIADKCFIGANALIATNTDADGVYVVPPAERSPMTSDRFMQLMSLHCGRR